MEISLGSAKARNLFTSILILTILTGCSNETTSEEPSPIEKRNRFDACVINWLAQNTTGTQSSADYFRPYAERECVHHLE